MRIYLDNNATTPLAPEVRDAMVACLDRCSVGNPSSIHSAGQEARRLVDRARAAVARVIGARPEEIIFTSGGAEADNRAVLGAAAAQARSSVQFSLGRDTTDDDIDGAVAALRQAGAALRGGGR